MREDVYKTVKRTAAISAGAIVALLLLAALSAFLFFPARAAELCSRIGSPLSVNLSVRAFEKDGDINDLALAVERSVPHGRHEVTAKYGKQLLARADFTDFCAFRDQSSEGSYADFVLGSTAAALYLYGSSDEALTLLDMDEYPQSPVADYLIAALEKSTDAGFAASLAALIQPRFEQYYTAFEEGDDSFRERAAACCVQLYRIHLAAGDAAKAAEYDAYYIILRQP